MILVLNNYYGRFTRCFSRVCFPHGKRFLGNEHTRGKSLPKKRGKAEQELTVDLGCCPLCPDVPVGGADGVADNGVRLQGWEER